MYHKDLLLKMLVFFMLFADFIKVSGRNYLLQTQVEINQNINSRCICVCINWIREFKFSKEMKIVNMYFI